MKSVELQPNPLRKQGGTSSSDVRSPATTMSASTGRRRTKYAKDRPEAMRRRNGIRRLQEMMVGGRAAVAALPPATRKRYRTLARRLYDAEQTTSGAERFIKRNKEGFVYIMEHPSWPGYVKIGRACDPRQRLNGYQTGCPMRAYRLIESVFFRDCHFAESELHARLSDHRESGEWFYVEPAVAVTQLYRLRELL